MSETQKPHVLYIGCEWCDANPDYGLNNAEYNILGSLETSGMISSYDRFHLDEYFHKHGRAGDSDLLQRCIQKRPDLIILDWMNLSGRPYAYNPSFETLDILSRKLNIPMIGLWWDMVWDMIIRNSEMLLPYVRLNVVLDTSSFLSKISEPEKYLLLWTPQDPRLYYDSGEERDIPVSFMGNPVRTGRREVIEALTKADIGFYHTGGQRENRVSPEEYAGVFRRSRISVNPSGAPPNFPRQLLGRVLEIMLCGAMLLEQENPETRRLFEPMTDYVPYNSIPDLLDKARYYLEHDDERAAVAENGHKKASTKYNNTVFWKTVFAQVFKDEWKTAPGADNRADETAAFHSNTPAEALNRLRHLETERIKLIEELNKLRADDAKVHNILGREFYKTGRVKEAIAAIQKSLAILPNQAEAHQNLAVIYYNGNKDLKATVEHLKSAIGIEPQNSELWHILIEIFRNHGIDAPSLEWLKQHSGLIPQGLIKEIKK